MSEKELLNIRVAVACSTIIGYCIANIDGKQDLKHRLKIVKASVTSLENYFKPHNQKEFLKNEYVMLKELLATCIAFDEDALEEIIEAIKINVN